MKVEVNAHVEQVVFDAKGAKVVLKCGKKEALRIAPMAGFGAIVTLDDGQDELPFDDSDAPEDDPLFDDTEPELEVEVVDVEGEVVDDPTEPAPAEADVATEEEPASAAEPESFNGEDVTVADSALELVNLAIDGKVARFKNAAGILTAMPSTDEGMLFVYEAIGKPSRKMWTPRKMTEEILFSAGIKARDIGGDDDGPFKVWRAVAQMAVGAKAVAKELPELPE